MPEAAERVSVKGLLLALAAYGSWGMLPIFWKQLAHLSAAEQLLHRVLWATVSFVVLATIARQWPSVRAAWANKNTRRTLALSAGLVAVNWFFFVYAVETERVLQTSLGYFINPLVSVVLGMVFLGERLRRAQWIAVALAAAGVAQLAFLADEVPFIALILAGAFGVYGLLRKRVKVDALPGSVIETLVLVGPCLVGIAFLHSRGSGHFGGDRWTTSLLLIAGPVTALPLLWFASAARQLRLGTLGFLQYLTPTLHFVFAVFLFREAFGPVHVRAFACIWLGLAVFVAESLVHRRQRPATSVSSRVEPS